MLRLVKSGYGNLKEVKEMNAREVLQAIHYETFLANLESYSIEQARLKE